MMSSSLKAVLKCPQSFLLPNRLPADGTLLCGNYKAVFNAPEPPYTLLLWHSVDENMTCGYLLQRVYSATHSPKTSVMQVFHKRENRRAALNSTSYFIEATTQWKTSMLHRLLGISETRMHSRLGNDDHVIAKVNVNFWLVVVSLFALASREVGVRKLYTIGITEWWSFKPYKYIVGCKYRELL